LGFPIAKPNTSFLGLLGVAQRVAEGFRDYDARDSAVRCAREAPLLAPAPY